MRTRLEREPDGCWVLWEPSPAGGWRVAAEGRWWPWGLIIKAWRAAR